MSEKAIKGRRSKFFDIVGPMSNEVAALPTNRAGSKYLRNNLGNS